MVKREEGFYKWDKFEFSLCFGDGPFSYVTDRLTFKEFDWNPSSWTAIDRRIRIGPSHKEAIHKRIQAYGFRTGLCPIIVVQTPDWDWTFDSC